MNALNPDRASGRLKRVGVLTTHPIQYQVPWFRLLEEDPRVELEVFFCQIPDAKAQGDGFGVSFEWDVPLLGGYRHRVLENRAANPSVTRFSGCNTPEIAGIVGSGNWDAFIVNGWLVWSCIQLLIACRRYGVPCIARGEVNGLSPRPFWKHLAHRALFKQYAAFLSIGSRNAQYLREHGVSANRIWSTPYSVDNDRFPFQQRPPYEGRCVSFLFSGKLENKKRPLDILAAARLLLEQGLSPQQFEVVFAGDGELRDAIEAEVALAGLPVRMLGFVNQSRLLEVYANADCLLLPSESGETWGLVVNEAMATGLPVIVSNTVGCAMDLVRDGDTGLTFSLGDVSALAQRMSRIIGEEDRARAMGRHAAETVREGFSPALVAQGVVDAVYSLDLR